MKWFNLILLTVSHGSSSINRPRSLSGQSISLIKSLSIVLFPLVLLGTFQRGRRLSWEIMIVKDLTSLNEFPSCSTSFHSLIRWSPCDCVLHHARFLLPGLKFFVEVHREHTVFFPPSQNRIFSLSRQSITWSLTHTVISAINGNRKKWREFSNR